MEQKGRSGKKARAST